MFQNKIIRNKLHRIAIPPQVCDRLEKYVIFLTGLSKHELLRIREQWNNFVLHAKRALSNEDYLLIIYEKCR